VNALPQPAGPVGLDQEELAIMWITIALAAVLNLAPDRQDALELKNARFTYGPLGRERKDAKILGGEVLYITFDITGLKVRDDGRVQYCTVLEVVNKEGKLQYKEDPQDAEGYAALGGSRIPASTHVLVGTEQSEGEYEIKVTVKDRANGVSDSCRCRFQVLPPKFGLVQVGMSYLVPDSDVNFPAPAVGVVGQRLLVNFTVVGFDLDKSRKDQPHVETSMRVFDEAGKQTLAEPYSGVVKEVDPAYKKGIPMQFLLQLNRPGRFRIELKATDQVTGKTAEQTLRLTVVEPD
jgi:hypothetical protein